MSVPTKRSAFVTGRAQLFTATAGTALPGDLNTSTTGLISLNQQTITLPTTPTGGTFTLTYNGVTSSALDHDSTASEVATALNGLSTLGTGQVDVSGSASGPYVVSFSGSIGQAGYVEPISVTDSTTGGTGTASVASTRTFLGWTEGDTQLNIEETWAEHMVNEVLSAVDHSPESEAGTISATLSEATLAAWNRAMSGGTYTTQAAGATQTEYEKLGFGGVASEAAPVQLLIYAKNRQGYAQLWVCHRVVRQLNAGPSFARGGKVVVPVNGTLQFDGSQATGNGLWTAYNITGLPTG